MFELNFRFHSTESFLDSPYFIAELLFQLSVTTFRFLILYIMHEEFQR